MQGLATDDAEESLRIGIAIPTYDRPELLQKLLASVPADVAVTVSDNGLCVSRKIHSFGSNVRVVGDGRVIRMFENWNRAMMAADADFVAIPSDDDLYMENDFETVRQEISNNPDCDLFVFGNHFIDGNDTIFSTWMPPNYLKYAPPHGFRVFERGVDARMPSIFFRKSFLDCIGYFDSRFDLTAADSDLIQRALLLGRVLFVPKVVGCYRVWGGAFTAKNIAADLWLNEVAMWTGKIAMLANQEFQKVGEKFDPTRYVDEIYGRNLIAGAGNKVNSGEKKEARKYLLSHRFPWRASLATKLSYLHIYLKSYYRR